MKLLRLLAIGLLAFGISSAARASEPVTTEDVSKFVKALPDVEVFSEGLRKEGKDKALATATMPVKGDKNYRPYSKGVELMKAKFPEEYKELGGIVTKNGFASQENWASVSDSVMLAYMSLKIDQENPHALEQMKNIPAETKKQMPPEALAQIDQSIALMEIFTSAPAANKEAVKPHMGEITAWLERTEMKDKAAAANQKAKKDAPKSE